MNKIIFSFMFLGHLMMNSYSQTPSDIKRTQLEIEHGDVDLHRANIGVKLGAGVASSSPGTFKEGEVKFGTRLILAGYVATDSAMGLALAPDLVAKIRLDENGKKQRLELGGKLISIYEMQFLNYKPLDKKERDLYTAMVFQPESLLENDLVRIENEKKALQMRDQKSKEDKDDVASKIAILNEEQKTIRMKLKIQRDFKQNAVPYFTFDVSLLNLGAKYHEVKDGNFKFIGFSGSLGSASFDIMAKSKDGKIRMGVCGFAEMASIKAGALTSEFNSGVGEKKILAGLNGSVCLKFAVGPIMVNNTLSAGMDAMANPTNDRERKSLFANINNNARVGVRTGVIPGVLTEVGAFYNYSKEWYGEGNIDSHMVGGGITVLPK